MSKYPTVDDYIAAFNALRGQLLAAKRYSSETEDIAIFISSAAKRWPPRWVGGITASVRTGLVRPCLSKVVELLREWVAEEARKSKKVEVEREEEEEGEVTEDETGIMRFWESRGKCLRRRPAFTEEPPASPFDESSLDLASGVLIG